MPSIKSTVKEYLVSEETKRGLLALVILVIIDAVVAVVGTVFIHQHALLILSNLLFLEGGPAFALGSFITVVASSPRRQEKKRKSKEEKQGKPPNEEADDYLPKVSNERASKYLTEETEPVHMPIGPLLVLLGVILMALSVVVLLPILLV